MDISIVDCNYRSKYSLGLGKAPGTFGELLQGVLPNRKKFMVTFPINLFSQATFVPNIAVNDIKSFPPHKIKSVAIAEKLLKHFNLKMGGELFINTEIPEGKGLASSSADLVATAYAVANSIKVKIDEEIIAKCIAEIEPSDGVMYSGIVSFYHQEVKLINTLGNLSSLTIIAVDEGYMLDTIEYNAKAKFYSSDCAIKYQEMLEQMTIAIRNKDLAHIGRIATQSAIMNQKNNPKKFLHDLISICNEINGLGVVVAHSGTFIGILLDPTAEKFIMQKEFCIDRLKNLSSNVSIFSSIDFNYYTDLCDSAVIEEQARVC